VLACWPEDYPAVLRQGGEWVEQRRGISQHKQISHCKSGTNRAEGKEENEEDEETQPAEKNTLKFQCKVIKNNCG